MSAANAMRLRAAQVMLVIGALLLLIGALTNAGWSVFAFSLGGMFTAFGAIVLASVSIVDGVPWLVRLFSRVSEPVWDGETIHTDGSLYKIRYRFDEHGSPRFVASDVCIAVGMPAPAKEALKWGGISLLSEGKYAYFTEAGVQAYLLPMSIKNHAANRLLLIIRNNVLRKLEKQREERKRYEREQG